MPREASAETSRPCPLLRWTPPCPPGGDDPHRYVWSVYALRDPSGLEAGAQPAAVAGAVRDGVLASGTITARYARR